MILPGIYYLSFADDNKFRGAVYLYAHNSTHAVERSWKMGCNPGGEVMILGPIRPDQIPNGVLFSTLLSREDMDALGANITLEEADKKGLLEGGFTVPMRRMEGEKE